MEIGQMSEIIIYGDEHEIIREITIEKMVQIDSDHVQNDTISLQQKNGMSY